MLSSGSVLRQLGEKEAWKSSSKRWGGKGNSKNNKSRVGDGELNNLYGSKDGGGIIKGRKRVMVVVDHPSYSKHAMIWALTHVAENGDLLTLLHITPLSSSHKDSSHSPSSTVNLLNSSLVSLSKACKPEVN